MHQKPYFLGWTRTLADAVAARVLATAGEPWSLRDTIVVVPTAQAGRRLRRALARQADAHGAGVLSGPVVTPFQLFPLLTGERQPVDDATLRALWLETLSPERIRQLNGLYPKTPPNPDIAWRRVAVDRLLEVRAQIAEAGLTLGDIAASEFVHAAEKPRWRDLAFIESVVQSRLDELGWDDPVAFQLKASRTAPPPEGIRRVALAACPDLAPLVRALLDRWAATIDVEPLVHGTDELAGVALDAWGCPVTAHWRNEALLDLEAPQVTIRVVDQPRDQAAAVGDALAAFPAWAAAGRFAVGVPDESVTPFVVRELEQMGCPTFDPSGTSYRMHPIFRFVETWVALAGQRNHEALRAWIRHADVLAYLGRTLKVDAATLISELDAAQNEFIPASLDDLAGHIDRRAGDYPGLCDVLRWLLPRLDDPAVRRPSALMALLSEIHSDTLLTPGRAADDGFMEVARAFSDAVAAAEQWAPRLHGLDDAAWCHLLIEGSSAHRYVADHRTGSMELEGWLELPWNDAPLTVVTGMNEGSVPSGRMDHLFLPDSVRERLGMRCDATRFARDAYLLLGLQASRRAEGHLVLIAGRQTEQGDVLKPSRLFWRCPDEVLARRAEAFFTAQERVVSLPEREFATTLNLDPPDDQARQRLKRPVMNVTDFAAYLRCPFRYYLTRVLEMRGMDDAKEELDDLDFGHLVHDALEQFGRDPHLPFVADADTVADFLADRVHDAVIRRYGQRPPVVVRLQAESAVQRLRGFARVHVDELAQGWRLVEVERRCIMPLDGYEVRGKIDRIDRHADGRWRVLDYKTSDRVKRTPAAAHLIAPRDIDARSYVGVSAMTPRSKQPVLRHWSDLQLPLYIAFARAAFPEAASFSAGYIQLTKAVSDIQVNVWNELDEAMVASALACARGVIADIRRGCFGPPLVAVADDEFDERFWPDFIAQVTPPGAGVVP